MIKVKGSNLFFSTVLGIILIGFSPLLNQYVIITTLSILTFLNFNAIKFSKDSRSLLLLSILFILLIDAIRDALNVKSLNDYSPLNFYYPLTFIFGYLFSQKYTINSYLTIIHTIIFPIAIFSLIGIFITYVLPGLIYNLPSYNYYHTTHKTAIFFNILLDEETGGIIKRNTGIAWEPGAFQFLLNMGLFSYLKIDNKKISSLIIFIYVVSIIFTRSSVGLLILIFQFLRVAKSNKLYRYFLVIIFILFSANIISEINYQMQYKFNGSLSFKIRYEPMVEAFKQGSNNLFGLGNVGYNYLSNKINLLSFDSYSQIVVRYGYILLILLLYGLYKIIRYDSLLFFIIFITFFGETIWFFPFITPFYFFKYQKVKA